jgi:hypothetical protein
MLMQIHLCRRYRTILRIPRIPDFTVQKIQTEATSKRLPCTLVVLKVVVNLRGTFKFRIQGLIGEYVPH